MTDQEIYHQIIGLMETNQGQEEVHLLHSKLIHKQLELLQEKMANILRLAMLPASEERSKVADKMLLQMEDVSFRLEINKVIARIESHHERNAHMLTEMRAMIERLGEG